ncbi:hypothetical protein NL676_038278 [Syzygium grande]|nr:hypothetical protein NL676_038278 [Syzygium grande]
MAGSESAKIGVRCIGKRGTEEASEKQVNAKKRKRDGGIQQSIQKKKAEAKTTIKKKEYNSSSDDSDFEEEENEPAPKGSNYASLGQSYSDDSESSDYESEDDEDTSLSKLVLASRECKQRRAEYTGMSIKFSMAQESAISVDETDSEDDSLEESDEEPRRKKDADADTVDASPAAKEVPMSEKKAV